VHNRAFTAAGVDWPVIGVVYGRHQAEIEPGAGAIADPDNYPGDAGKTGLCLNAWFWPDNWTYDAGGHINGIDPLTDDMTDRGIAVLPALEVQKVVSGSVIDFTYYLVLRDGVDPALKATLDNYAGSGAGVKLYAPGKEAAADTDTDLRAIITELRTIAAAADTGPRTGDLAPLVQSTTGAGN